MPITRTTQEFINGLKAHHQLNHDEEIVLERVISAPGRFVTAYITGMPSKYKAKMALKRLVEMKIVYCSDFKFFVFNFSEGTRCGKTFLNTNCVHTTEPLDQFEPEHELCSSSLTPHLVPVKKEVTNFGIN